MAVLGIEIVKVCLTLINFIEYCDRKLQGDDNLKGFN